MNHERLLDLYWRENKDLKELAAIFGISTHQIRKNLQRATRLSIGAEARTESPPHSRPSEGELIDLYQKQERSMEQIASAYGVTRVTVSNWCRAYGIPARSLKKPPPSFDALDAMYNQSERSQQEIADHFGVGTELVRKWLRQAGIAPRAAKCGGRWEAPPPRDVLYDLYVKQGKGTYQIADVFGTYAQQVNRWLIRYGIPTRTQKRTMPPKEELLRLYVVEQLSVRQISEQFGVCWPTVRAWLVTSEIPLRGRLGRPRGNKEG